MVLAVSGWQEGCHKPHYKVNNRGVSSTGIPTQQTRSVPYKVAWDGVTRNKILDPKRLQSLHISDCCEAYYYPM